MTKADNDVVDLYSGCGGFALGAHLAGFNTKVAIDHDSTLSSAYSLNFPGTKLIHADLERLTAPELTSYVGKNRVAGVIGGPPCQGFSLIGHRDRSDDRNRLVGHFFRHVATLRPKFFVMENVPGILEPRSFETVTEAVERLPKSYTVLPTILLDAADVGAPTVRVRAFIVGFDRSELDTLTLDDFGSNVECPKTIVSEAIQDLPSPRIPDVEQDGFGWWQYSPSSDKVQLSTYAKRMHAAPARGLGWPVAMDQLRQSRVSGLLTTSHNAQVQKRFGSTSPGATEPISRYPRLRWDGQCPTLRAGTGSDRGSYQAVRPIHPNEARVITVREAARLQGFPDWFVFHPTKWHSFRMIGNSVSPIAAEAILTVLATKLGIAPQSVRANAISLAVDTRAA